RFNRNHGIRLIKIFHSIFDNTETSSTSYDNSSVTGGLKAQVFHTKLNDKRLQDYNLILSSQDDYVYLKEQLTKSVIQSSDMFYYNWLWIENFSGIDKFSKQNYDNLEVGLDL